MTPTESRYTVLDYAVASRPLQGEVESGDLHVVISRPGSAVIAVADGLGHGYHAAFAARVAIDTLTAQAHLPLLDVVRRCHEALVKTRGVAMIVASLSGCNESMTWLSIGNVAGVLLRASDRGNVEREHVLMRGGVLGHRLPPVRATTQQMRRGDLLVFATDGVREGFESDVRLNECPQDVADRILTRYGKATDDALVLVGKWNGASKTGAAS